MQHLFPWSIRTNVSASVNNKQTRGVGFLRTPWFSLYRRISRVELRWRHARWTTSIAKARRRNIGTLDCKVVWPHQSAKNKPCLSPCERRHAKWAGRQRQTEAQILHASHSNPSRHPELADRRPVPFKVLVALSSSNGRREQVFATVLGLANYMAKKPMRCYLWMPCICAEWLGLDFSASTTMAPDILYCV